MPRVTPSPEPRRGQDAATGRGARGRDDKGKGGGGGGGVEFAGFRPIDANFIYTPNQFFDVLLPNHSRGCVRLVGYLLRRTLGWLDAEGRPLEQRIGVTYRELIAEAGVSRGGIAKAVDEATAAGYVRCARRGRAKAAGVSAVSARYELRWDDSGAWRGDPASFRGFFTGEGRRTPVPEDYFDVVLPREPLAVGRVVGVVLRQTVGYQNQFGGRRAEAALSYSDLQRRTGLADRKTLAAALARSLDAGYVERLAEGSFDPDAGRRSLAARYGPRWITRGDGSESPPASPPSRRSRKPTGSSVQPPHRRRSENPTGDGPTAPPAHKEERHPKDIFKQPAAPDTLAVPGESAAAAGLLLGLGFEEKAVRAILAGATPEAVIRQAAWLPRRAATRNRLGLLRRAIAEDWPEPAAGRAEAARDETRRVEARREAHVALHRDAYRAHLLAVEDELRDGEDWPAFERWRGQQRRRHEALPEPARSTKLDEWASPARRLRDLRSFFGDRVPDFWQWDRTRNPQPLDV